ncbi:MAG: HPr family phosphocarrier protein [Andreesenia angusta]|nr:HPr family phosphocarrier protein [Andreesenia angusta]
MIKKTFKLKEGTGLHSRAAAKFVKITSSFESDVFLEKGNMNLNAKSIMGLLSTGITGGDEIDIIVDGEDEKEAMEAIEEFIVTI